MKTPFWSPFISDGTIKAICWTLIHSLWIGLVIALLCGIVIATTRKATAALRYRLLCGLLVLFVGAIGVTYCLEAASGSAPVASGAPAKPVINIQHNIVINPLSIAPDQTLLENVQGFLNQNISIIFLVWLLFFMLKSLKMASGLLYIQRIRNYKTHAVTDELKHRIEHFSSQIGIRRTVRLVQSELVKVPIAVGWLKPMILLPLGIAFQLTPEQLDGILWHELAHIRRRDYLVNILQGLVKTVFFFNPGLLWLSSLIRTEREACCDDLVLSRLNRKANYLEALLSFGYGEFNQAKYAMSIGSGNQLRDRLRRMISQENKRLSLAEKSVLVIGLALLTALTAISKDSVVVKHLTVKFTNKPGKMVAKAMTVSMHRLPGEQRVNDRKPGAGEKNTITLADTVIRFITILFKHSDEDWANNDISAKDDKGNKYHFIVVDGKISSLEVNGEKIAEDKLPGYDYTLQLIISELAEKRHIRQTDMAGVKALNPEARLKMAELQRMEDSLKAGERDARAKYLSMSKSHSRPVKMQRATHDAPDNYTRALKKMTSIIADLVKDKVIDHADEVKWFGLSDTEFIVNGKKLSNEMQQRYRAKYGVSEGNGLYYGPVQMTGKGEFIDEADMRARSQHTERPAPKYIGATSADSRDTLTAGQQELLRQQQLFAAKEDAKRAGIVKGQMQLIAQQQHFADEQNEKRRQMMMQQQAILADQNEKIDQYRKKKWPQLRNPGSAGIDLETPVNSVIADLVDANVISDKSDLIRFNLTNGALIVNGKKQSEELHERLKLKYLGPSTTYPKDDYRTSPNFGLHYNSQTGNSGIGVTSEPDSP